MIDPTHSIVNVFVPGTPKPQPRPRAFARKMGNGAYAARCYDAGTAEGWKSAIASTLREHLPASPLTGPVSVSLMFIFPRPKGHRGKTGLKDSAPWAHTQRPDVDNLSKAVLDCMTTIGVWADDGQISGLNVWKAWDDHGQAGCWVSVFEVTRGPLV